MGGTSKDVHNFLKHTTSRKKITNQYQLTESTKYLHNISIASHHKKAFYISLACYKQKTYTKKKQIICQMSPTSKTIDDMWPFLNETFCLTFAFTFTFTYHYQRVLKIYSKKCQFSIFFLFDYIQIAKILK